MNGDRAVRVVNGHERDMRARDDQSGLDNTNCFGLIVQ